MNSEKSILQKLNFSKYPIKLILNKPADIADFDELEFHSSIEQEKYDLIMIFIYHLEEFSTYIRLIIDKQLVADKGYVYFAYPKKNNRQYLEYIDRDSFLNEMPVDEEGYIQDSNLKFAKMVSLNEVFTIVGLKSEAKKTKKTSVAQKSQCVDDYVEHIADIKRYLQKNEEIVTRYNELTYGYQKDWARYVFSAKKKETQDKRLVEMESILAEGYKSMDLFRRQKK